MKRFIVAALVGLMRWRFTAKANWAEMLPAGLLYSLLVHAHGTMKFCDHLQRSIRYFHFCG
jgi:hypothetical protein